MGEVAVTFVIAAYQAETTLEACILSVRQQTRSDWQVVIVDDGSTDGTAALADRLAAGDTRMSVIHQPNGGASAARNAGVAAATARYICLLDSDDWIDRDYLSKMLPVAEAGNGGVIPYCSFRRVDETGRHMKVSRPVRLEGEEAKQRFSEFCAITIHGALIPRHYYLEVGGMRAERRTCEDWELWLRLAFAGARFERVDACLCYYRMRTGSLTTNLLLMLDDALAVSRIGEELWATAKAPAQDQRLSPESRRIRLGVWIAGLAAPSDVTPTQILSRFEPVPNVFGLEAELSETLAWALDLSCPPTGSAIDTSSWCRFVEAFFSELENAADPGLKRSLWARLARSLAGLWHFDAPWRAGSILVANVDVLHPHAIAKPADVDTVVLRICKGAQLLGVVEVPLWTNLSAVDLIEIAASRFRAAMLSTPAAVPVLARFGKEASRRWPAVARILAKQDNKKRRLSQMGRQIWRESVRQTCIGTANYRSAQHAIQAQPVAVDTQRQVQSIITAPSGEQRSTADRLTYWEQVFNSADPWDYLSVYETRKYDQTLEILGDESYHRALEVACAEGIFTEKLSARVSSLAAADISNKALARAAERCKDQTNIDFFQLDLVSGEIEGQYDLIICSEVLYYLDSRATLETVLGKFERALAPGGVFVTAHAHLTADEPHRTGFDWDNPFGVGTIADVLQRSGTLCLEETIETELYSVLRFRKAPSQVESPPRRQYRDFGKPLDPGVEATVVWDSVVTGRKQAYLNERTSSLPVLMYHSIGNDFPEALNRYQTTPEAFADQMRLLRRHGYYTVHSSELVRRLSQARTLPGRPIAITFDDAYSDFAENAFPILERNGFSAEVFVVTDMVGKTATWDQRFGHAARLMGWDQIGDMHRAGTQFGSHLATHRPATFLTTPELAEEAIRSRQTLERELGSKVASIALPYGAYDDRVASILGLAGYAVGHSCTQGIADLGSNPLSLPRIEVRGGMSLTEFAAQLRIPTSQPKPVPREKATLVVDH